MRIEKDVSWLAGGRTGRLPRAFPSDSHRFRRLPFILEDRNADERLVHVGVHEPIAQQSKYFVLVRPLLPAMPPGCYGVTKRRISWFR